MWISISFAVWGGDAGRLRSRGKNTGTYESLSCTSTVLGQSCRIKPIFLDTMWWAIFGSLTVCLMIMPRYDEQLFPVLDSFTPYKYILIPRQALEFELAVWKVWELTMSRKLLTSSLVTKSSTVPTMRCPFWFRASLFSIPWGWCSFQDIVILVAFFKICKPMSRVDKRNVALVPLVLWWVSEENNSPDAIPELLSHNIADL